MRYPNRLLLARTVAVHVTFVLGMAGVPNSSVQALSLLYRETASHAGSVGVTARRLDDDVIYRVTPELTGGVMTALTIEMQLRGNESGVTRLDLPDHAGGGAQWSALIADLDVRGAQVTEQGSSLRVLTHAPRALITVHYRVLPGANEDLSTQPVLPVIRPNWFVVHGETAFILPEGRDKAFAQVMFGKEPKGWTLASDLDGTTSIGVLRDGLMIGGAGYHVAVRAVGRAPLRFVYPESLSGIAAPMLDEIVRVAAAERAFWREPAEPFFVCLIPLTDSSEYAGRGLYRGFAIYLGAGVSRNVWLHLFAHEHMHTWISRRIGGFPKINDDLEAWLNEGFTEAETARVLLRSGLWSLEQFVADQNTALVRYGTSPVKTAPNDRIQADRQRNFDVNKLPYDRGRLLAIMWDYRLRQASKGRLGLDDVLRAQERRATEHARAGIELSADKLFLRVFKQVSGLDLTEDMARYVDRGEAINLPSDLFGSCTQIVDVQQPVFDRGFDLVATLKAHGRITGLEAGGPADSAGLREGDHIKIDELPSHDSRVTLSYRVVANDGTERLIRYRPIGKTTVTFQQIILAPNLTPLQRAACARVMGGTH